jgi:hypothetical protein
LAVPDSVPTPPVMPKPQTLDWSLQNFGVIGAATALGTLSVKVGKRVVESFKQPTPTLLPHAQLVDPLSWLRPACLRPMPRGCRWSYRP